MFSCFLDHILVLHHLTQAMPVSGSLSKASNSYPATVHHWFLGFIGMMKLNRRAESLTL
jgi:hypothetical protein